LAGSCSTMRSRLAVGSYLALGSYLDGKLSRCGKYYGKLFYNEKSSYGGKLPCSGKWSWWELVLMLGGKLFYNEKSSCGEKLPCFGKLS
jgi:hypothetical protein